MAKEAAPTKFEIEAAELRRLIDKTRFAISTEETRYYLNGIFFRTVAKRPARACSAPSPPMATAWRSPTSKAPKARQRLPGRDRAAQDHRRSDAACSTTRRISSTVAASDSQDRLRASAMRCSPRN